MNNYSEQYSNREQRMKENKDSVIESIRRLMKSQGTEQELDELLKYVEDNTVAADVSDLIFWDNRDLSAEQIYELAMWSDAIEM